LYLPETPDRGVGTEDPRVRPARIALLFVVVVAACGSATPASPSPSSTPAAPSTVTRSPSASSGSSPSSSLASASGAARELAPGVDPIEPGTYTRSGFKPAITITLGPGWSRGTLTNGFFDVQQLKGTPDVIAVQFGLVEGVVGAGGKATPPTTARAAATTIHDNPGVKVIDESDSRLGGLAGFNVVVENQGTGHASILQVSPGLLGIDPGRRLWISFFDSADGLLAVMVGGSVAKWELALTTAEPVLEKVVVTTTG
jgi:hypothetical protein